MDDKVIKEQLSTELEIAEATAALVAGEAAALAQERRREAEEATDAAVAALARWEAAECAAQDTAREADALEAALEEQYAAERAA